MLDKSSIFKTVISGIAENQEIFQEVLSLNNPLKCVNQIYLAKIFTISLLPCCHKSPLSEYILDNLTNIVFIQYCHILSLESKQLINH